jgi:serine/threonine protein kinase
MNICKIKPSKLLGSGAFGATFIYYDEICNQSYIFKVTEYHVDRYAYEWHCMKYIYKVLYKYMPNHVIKPINTYICLAKNLDPFVFKSLPFYPNKQDEVRVMIFDKIGDCDLTKFLYKHSPLEPNVAKEIIFQIIIYFLYLSKYTRIIHRDVKEDNFIIKKNYKKICYKKYIIKPQYLCYPIDFGVCILNYKSPHSKDYIEKYYSNDDLIDVLEMSMDIDYEFRKYVLKLKLSALQQYDQDNKFGDKWNEEYIKRVEKLLDSEYFKVILLK